MSKKNRMHSPTAAVAGAPDQQLIEQEYAEHEAAVDEAAAPELKSGKPTNMHNEAPEPPAPEPRKWVFRSRYAMAVWVRVGKVTVPCRFELSMFVVTDDFVQPYGVTSEQVVEALRIRRPGYGVDYVMTAGPGYVPTDAVRKFALESAARASERVTEVQRGVRGNDKRG